MVFYQQLPFLYSQTPYSVVLAWAGNPAYKTGASTLIKLKGKKRITLDKDELNVLNKINVSINLTKSMNKMKWRIS